MNPNSSKKGTTATRTAKPVAGASRTGASAGKQGTRATRGADAIALLTEDHDRVKDMFKQYEKLGEDDAASKQALADRICNELTIHTTIEEEIFYPAAREALDDDDLMDEADVEHAAAKDLIAQIQDMEAGESHYDAKVKVLGEEVEHHIKEEQDEMFKKVRKTDLDLKALGAEMAERKAELQQELERE